MTLYVIVPLCGIGLVCNLLIVLVLGQDKSVSSMMRFLLQQLTLADCLFYVTCPLAEMSRNVDELRWQRNETLMTVLTTLSDASQTIAMWVAVVVTYQRYMAISRPVNALQYNKLSQARVAVGVVWISSILFNVPALVIENRSLGPMLKRLRFSRRYLRYINFAVNTVFTVWLPISLVVFFNIRIIGAVRKSNALHKRQHLPNNSHVISNDRRVTVTLITILFVFMACQIPSAAFLTIFKFTQLTGNYKMFPGISVAKLVMLLYMGLSSSVCLIVINSLADYITYLLMGKRFRQNLIRSLLCCIKTDSK